MLMDSAQTDPGKVPVLLKILHSGENASLLMTHPPPCLAADKPGAAKHAVIILPPPPLLADKSLIMPKGKMIGTAQADS